MAPDTWTLLGHRLAIQIHQFIKTIKSYSNKATFLLSWRHRYNLPKIGMSNKLNVFGSKYTKELKQNNPNRLRLPIPGEIDISFTQKFNKLQPVAAIAFSHTSCDILSSKVFPICTICITAWPWLFVWFHEVSFLYLSNDKISDVL
jgi:hypothetical protein